MWDIKDLELWIFLNNSTQEGIDINNVTYTYPISVGITDACETGLGGFGEDSIAQ